MRAKAALLMSLLPVLFLGCAHETRYRVARFLFDGVPPPEREVELIVEVPAVSDDTDVVASEPLIVKSGYDHQPYASGNCASCHDRDNSNAITESGVDLCLGCHTTVLTGKENTHMVVQIDCALCHNPHRSVEAFLLKKPTVDLCLDCHARADVEKVHGQIGACMSCHNPHESDMPSLLDFS